MMFSQLQAAFCEPKVQVPLPTAISPELIPLPRIIRSTEKLNFHLFKFARTKCEIPGSNLISKTLTNLADPKGHAHSRRVEHILEV